MNLFTTKIESIKKILDSLGLKSIKHTQGNSLFHHLVRVQEILEYWECDIDTQLAGMAHSLYSTEYFKKNVFDITDRNNLRMKLGTTAENIVYQFSILNRESFCYLENTNEFSFKNYITKETVTCGYDEGIAIAHIMLANDIDHIGILDVGKHTKIFQKYNNLYTILTIKAQIEVCKLIDVDHRHEDKRKDEGTFIRFIAHSGVQIADNKVSVVIDPWLYDSRRESPIIEGLDPTQRTIDYLIPEPKNTAEDLSPDIICISHFHTHHSPLKEILEFAKIKPVTVVAPRLDESKLLTIKQKIGDYMYGRINFIFVDSDKEISVKGVEISVYSRRRAFMVHLIYKVKLNNKSIVHVVDAVLDESNESAVSFSKKWESLYNSKPDFLFIGAAGHLLKDIRKGERVIVEGTSLTPAQSAKLASLILPRHAGVIGIYNHSVWDDRYEMSVSVNDAESHFSWCLSYLAPTVEIKKLLPGDIFY